MSQNEHTNDMSEEDRAALELILQEEQQQVAPIPMDTDEDTNPNSDPNQHSNQAHEQANEEANLSNNPDNWTYDQLLDLGEALGDVKTEKWRVRASAVIESLPIHDYSDLFEVLWLYMSMYMNVYQFISSINTMQIHTHAHVLLYKSI